MVSDTIFANAKYRGKRLWFDESVDLAERRQMYLRKRIRVHDARALEPAPTLDDKGFQLVEAPIRMDFFNRELVKTRFYDYCSNLVEAVTGCVGAKVLQHEFRDGGPMGGVGGYAVVAHGDVTPYVEDIMDVPDGRHFGLFNVWRSIDPEREIEVMPLAVCDGATVSPADMVCCDSWRRTEPRTRLVDYRLVHNGGQCWYCFPRMTPDEALIFVQYVRAGADANRRVTFHCAFKDPTTREGAPLRQSVEARVLAVFREDDPERERRRARFQAELATVRLDGTTSESRHEDMVDWNKDQESVYGASRSSVNPVFIGENPIQAGLKRPVGGRQERKWLTDWTWPRELAPAHGPSRRRSTRR